MIIAKKFCFTGMYFPYEFVGRLFIIFCYTKVHFLCDFVGFIQMLRYIAEDVLFYKILKYVKLNVASL